MDCPAAPAQSACPLQAGAGGGGGGAGHRIVPSAKQASRPFPPPPIPGGQRGSIPGRQRRGCKHLCGCSAGRLAGGTGIAPPRGSGWRQPASPPPLRMARADGRREMQRCGVGSRFWLPGIPGTCSSDQARAGKGFRKDPRRPHQKGSAPGTQRRHSGPNVRAQASCNPRCACHHKCKHHSLAMHAPRTLDYSGRVKRQRVQVPRMHPQHVLHQAGGDVRAVDGSPAPVVPQASVVVCKQPGMEASQVRSMQGLESLCNLAHLQGSGGGTGHPSASSAFQHAPEWAWVRKNALATGEGA